MISSITEFDYDMEKISVLYVAWKCFTKELKQNVANKLKSCPEGVILITLSHAMTEFDNSWKIIAEIRRSMSWGIAILIVHIKNK